MKICSCPQVWSQKNMACITIRKWLSKLKLKINKTKKQPRAYCSSCPTQAHSEIWYHVWFLRFSTVLWWFNSPELLCNNQGVRYWICEVPLYFAERNTNHRSRKTSLSRETSWSRGAILTCWASRARVTLKGQSTITLTVFSAMLGLCGKQMLPVLLC